MNADGKGVSSEADDFDLYMDAMQNGRSGECLVIERKHGLDGYPPSIVAVGLVALRDDKDMAAAIDAELGIES